MAMRRPFALAAIVLLSGWIAACGGTTRTTSTAPRTTTTEAGPRQTDAHISSYGSPAPEPERREITALVKRYYAAAAADDGVTACRLLDPTLARAVSNDYGGPTGSPETRGETCPVVLAKLLEHDPGEPFADLGTTRVTGVRLNPNGSEAFVQLSSRDMPTGEIFVQRKGQGWQVGVPLGRSCNDCAA